MTVLPNATHNPAAYVFQLLELNFMKQRGGRI
jgi:hypothetical protein